MTSQLRTHDTSQLALVTHQLLRHVVSMDMVFVPPTNNRSGREVKPVSLEI